ncbi:MAG: NAD(P)/FAD-dependent oxidoreductase [Parcubacteria group bacterium]|nr:NAD(P)/FAD-dependent oxidoreductase [Parcubacteria group bacterium]
MASKKQSIVILGAGFGGVYVHKRLQSAFRKDRDISMTVINERDCFLFTPLLHEVATGGQRQENIIEPLYRALGSGTLFRITRATRVDPARGIVATAGGDIPYDYLALATGSRANFFGIPGAQEHCFALKSLEDAVRLKNFVTDSAKRPGALGFVVVGGGATGVELSAELVEFTRNALRRKDTAVTLVELGTDLIPQFGSRLRKEALKVLRKKGIDVRLGTGVASVSADSAALTNGERIPANAVIWTAGVSPNAIPFAGNVALAKNGAYAVNEYLQLANYKNIFALGDVASFTNPGEIKPVPQHAQTAVAEATCVAENIIRSIKKQPLKAFRYHHTGDLVSLGRWRAVGEIAGIALSGRFAWWLWRTVYLGKLLTWRKRVAVAIDWTIQLFMRRDTGKL